MTKFGEESRNFKRFLSNRHFLVNYESNAGVARNTVFFMVDIDNKTAKATKEASLSHNGIQGLSFELVLRENLEKILWGV